MYPTDLQTENVKIQNSRTHDTDLKNEKCKNSKQSHTYMMISRLKNEKIKIVAHISLTCILNQNDQHNTYTTT